MRLLVACEFSGIVRDAFAAKGWDAWSCDLLPSERTGQHIQDDVFNHLDEDWDVLIFFWPCTWSTRSGAGWLFRKPKKPNPKILYLEDRRKAMIESANQFRRLLDCNIPFRCGENPQPYIEALRIMGQWTQKIQPWQFGHGECKGTCLWLRGLPNLEPTHRKDDLFALPEPLERQQRLHKLPPSPHRWKERSRTYTGIAAAMADQWTKFLSPASALSDAHGMLTIPAATDSACGGPTEGGGRRHLLAGD